MSNYHYLDESGKAVGPVSIEEIEQLAESFRQKGRELLVARPGDSRWLPYATGAKEPVRAATAPQQPVRPMQAQQQHSSPAAQPQRPQQAAMPVRPQQVVVQPQQMQPMGMPQGMASMPPGFPPSGFPGFSMRSTWLSSTIRIVFYAFAVLGAGTAMTFFILFIAGIASGKAETAVGGVMLLPMAGGFLLGSIFLAWSGKIVSLLEEIASALKR